MRDIKNKIKRELKHNGRTLKNNNKEIERKRNTAVIELKEIGGLEWQLKQTWKNIKSALHEH